MHIMHLLLFLSPDWYINSLGFIYFPFLSDEGPMLETLDFTIRIGSTPTFLYFDLYLDSCLRSTLRLFKKKV